MVNVFLETGGGLKMSRIFKKYQRTSRNWGKKSHNNFTTEYTTKKSISDVEVRSKESIQNATQTQKGEKYKREETWRIK